MSGRQSTSEPSDHTNAVHCLRALRVEESFFFGPCRWSFEPGVNVLLGRNGYGKSLLLRSLATLLDATNTDGNALVAGKSSFALELTRDGMSHTISSGGANPLGRVPILAIPDSRLYDRRNTAVGPSEDSYDDLKEHGAYHFLNDHPYGDVVKSLVYEICLDYQDNGQSFDLPVFGFFRKVFHELTGHELEFSAIERSGRSTYTVRVLTEGADVPVNLRHASQGTLSVIALFGLVRAYLKALHPEDVGERLLRRPAIVLVDELDAHLHPQWQMRIASVLRETFPHVQFVVTAHSPLVVAGALPGEVAVLRRPASDRFRIEQPERDFVGASAAELYQALFEIEEVDDAVVQHPEWEPMPEDRRTRLQALMEQARTGKLPALEALELAALRREHTIRDLVADVREDRQVGEDETLELRAEIERLKDELATTRDADRG